MYFLCYQVNTYSSPCRQSMFQSVDAQNESGKKGELTFDNGVKSDMKRMKSESCGLTRMVVRWSIDYGPLQLYS